ncbi:MAG: 2'-5' RNA ligase family protein [Pirellulales bacterium]
MFFREKLPICIFFSKENGVPFPVTSLTRKQASLYLTNVPQVEAMRWKFNPQQAQLIPAHVTLCREDEVDDWQLLHERIEAIKDFELTLSFGEPKRDENFVYLPIVDGDDRFHDLRRVLLDKEPRRATPHVTIIHPRNGICDDQAFHEIRREITPFQFTFREIFRIQQFAGEGWIRF